MNFSDLARQLNVSTATVSRALSRPDKVAPATRKRVLEFVRRSGYHINGVARSLRTQSTRTIGVIVSDIRNPFSSAIVKSVEDVARTNGYTVLICNADEDGRNEEAALELFLERQVSGVIHCSAGANLDLLRVLFERSIPLVDLDRQSGLQDVDTVILGNPPSSRIGTSPSGHDFRTKTSLERPQATRCLPQNTSLGADCRPKRLRYVRRFPRTIRTDRCRTAFVPPDSAQRHPGCQQRNDGWCTLRDPAKRRQSTA